MEYALFRTIFNQNLQCRPVRSTFAVRETASLGIMGAPRVPPLNPSESIVLWGASRHHGVHWRAPLELLGISPHFANQGGAQLGPHYAKGFKGGPQLGPPLCKETSVDIKYTSLSWTDHHVGCELLWSVFFCCEIVCFCCDDWLGKRERECNAIECLMIRFSCRPPVDDDVSSCRR